MNCRAEPIVAFVETARPRPSILLRGIVRHCLAPLTGSATTGTGLSPTPAGAGEAERPVSVKLADLRWSERERKGCADSGHSPGRRRTTPLDPKLPFPADETSVAREISTKIGTLVAKPRLLPFISSISSRHSGAWRGRAKIGRFADRPRPQLFAGVKIQG